MGGKCLKVPILKNKVFRPLARGMSKHPSGCSVLMLEVTRDPTSPKEALPIDQSPQLTCYPGAPADRGTHSTARDKNEKGGRAGDRVGCSVVW